MNARHFSPEKRKKKKKSLCTSFSLLWPHRIRVTVLAFFKTNLVLTICFLVHIHSLSLSLSFFFSTDSLVITSWLFG